MSVTLDFDTGPLNWVRGDIEVALKGASDRVRAFGTDNSLENALRLARDETHMATGALRMVGLEGAARVCNTLEDVLTGINGKTIHYDVVNEKTLLDAIEALLKWVNRMAEGRGEGELALFPVYQKLKSLAGEQVFEGELFYPNLRVQREDSPSQNLSGAELTALVKGARANFQRGLLAFLRGAKSDAGLATMRKSVSEVEGALGTPAARAFWWACAGFLDALQHKGIEADFHVKQLLARIDLQMRRLMEGSPQVAERLMRDALYFVAISKKMGSEASAVKQAFALEKYVPRQQYLDAEFLARARPVLKSLKDTLSEMRNLWGAYSEGREEALREFETAGGRLFTQAGALNNISLGGLVGELNDAVGATQRLNPALREAVQIEVATTLLFLQTCVDTEEVLDASFQARAQNQIRRLHAARKGEAEASATDLMDESSQKAAEHALFAQLGKEIGSSLQQMEEHLDTFFRDADAREGLSTLESLAAQVQGALAILDQPEAATLLQHAIAEIKPYLHDGEPSNMDKVRIADALSSLGLFVEAHCAGRQDAQRILRPAQIAFGLAEDELADDEPETVEAGIATRKRHVADAYLDWQVYGGEPARKKCLAALTELGHDADLIADASLKSATAAAIELVREPAEPSVDIAEHIARLTGLELAALLAETTRSATPNTAAPETAAIDLIEVVENGEASAEPVVFDGIEFTSEPLSEAPVVEQAAEITPSEDSIEFEPVAMEMTSPVEFEPAAEPAIESTEAEAVQEETAETPPEQAGQAEVESRPAVDQELLDIFLEEAVEVLENLGNAADACEINSEDRDNLTVIRRAFHTLKGSGRMVGLIEFGETAWGMEQLMNGWLAAEKSANAALLSVVRRARDLFANWVDALRSDSTSVLDTEEVLAQAHHVGAAPEAEASPATSEHPPVAEAPAEPETEVEITLIDEAEADGIELEETVAAQAEEPVAAPAEVQIGDVRLSEGLFEVFKNESSQWASTLDEEAVRLAMSTPSLVSPLVMRGVHTLAGIAGTTGFMPLSDLAHAIEDYFKRLDGLPIPSAAITLVQDALAGIGNMIRSIHSGQPPEADPNLLNALHMLPLSEAGAVEEVEEHAVEEPTAEITTPVMPVVEEVVTESLPPEELPVQEPVEAATPAAPTEDEISLQDMIEQARKAATPVFEQRRVQDEIDEVLLPIFLEEADTLVPEAASALRNWVDNPTGKDAPSALRRVLHTIKGSARMAGAMRLGELTHIMESRVISVLEGQTQISPAVFETLQDQFDRMADTVDRLKSGEIDSRQPAETTHTDTEVGDAEVLIPEIAPAGEEETPADAEAVRPADVPRAAAPMPAEAQAQAATLRVRADWVDRMVNQAGEVAIARSRIESDMFALKRQVSELSDALRRLKDHLREVEIQAESQMQATFQSQVRTDQFDPLEFDRFTRFQEVTRFMAESVHDVFTVQQNLTIQLDEADAALLQQSRINRELQQNLLRVRMVPLYSVSERLYRVVRQAARDANKRAQLDIQGGDLELDRGVLEKVVAPLEHLLRNAIAHGLETAEGRSAAGKSEFGEVRLIARHEGNEMVLIVKDDGAGLNLPRIREKAVAQGLLSPGVEPSQNQLAQLIFHAGLSTASEVTQLSGRGVGMDVVKNEIAELGGRVEIATETGKGVTFTIFLPLTLAVTQAVMVSAYKTEYALPATLVQQVQELRPEQLQAALQARAIEWRGNRYPLFYLPHLLSQPEAIHETQRYNAIVLMKSGSSYAGLLVDNVEGTREVVVKNIGPQLSRVTGIAGATVRGDGKVVLILNPVPLAIRALSTPQEPVEQVIHTPTPGDSSVETQSPLVLVVDDSLTVRKITSRLMTREGYRVDTAKDGVDALEKMQDLLPDIILLDVEMPRMDGFELARVVRNDAKLKHIPIIMITSRTADKHRNHALEIGVNVYLGKPFQEALLLGHINELVGAALPA